MSELESYISEATLEEAQGNAHKCVPHQPFVRKEKAIPMAMPAREVAEIMGLSEIGVRQIEKRALEKLRKMSPKAVALREFY